MNGNHRRLVNRLGFETYAKAKPHIASVMLVPMADNCIRSVNEASKLKAVTDV